MSLLLLAGIKDPGMSGNLEVRVVGGKLLHSKKGGAGFVDTDAKMDKIIEGVEEALAAQWCYNWILQKRCEILFQIVVLCL